MSYTKDRINTWQSMYDTLLPLTCCLTPYTLMHMYDHAVLGEKNNISVCKNQKLKGNKTNIVEEI